MRWDDSHESPDLIDRRGDAPVGEAGGIGNLLFLVPWLLRSRVGRIVLLIGLVVVGWQMWMGSRPDAQRAHGGSLQGTGAQAETPEVHFVSFVPDDVQVYIDLGFFHELSGKLGARGQFAQAYVIAHELGHHVQKLLGISERVPGGAHGATSGSVRLEL